MSAWKLQLEGELARKHYEVYLLALTKHNFTLKVEGDSEVLRNVRIPPQHRTASQSRCPRLQ